MLEFITRLVQPIVQIKRDEWRKAIPMFLYFACTIATLYILKPIRTSVFLTAHGAANLRYAYIGEGIFLILVTFGYVRLSTWFARKRTLFTVATLFFIGNILGFWFLFHFHPVEWLAFLFYIWVAAYSITIVTQFWTLANDIFDPREAKRLFGLILSGGSLGGVLGGLVTNRAAQRIGTENLLLIVVVLLAACLAMIYLVMREEPRRLPVHEDSKRDPMERLKEKSTWKLFLGSRYLLLIAALVVITKMCSTLIDNQFNSIVENTILEKNARTAFFGGFLAFLNVISFVLQLVVASYALRYLGIGISLLLLPIGLCFGSAATLFFPTLLAACFTKAYDGSMNYSISQLGKEILYIPVKSSTRYRVKPIIDMLGFRISKSIAGVFIIFVTALFGIPDEKLGLVVILLIPLWVLVVWAVRDEYIQTIKQLLASPQETNPIAAQERIECVLERLESGASFETLKPFLIYPSTPARKIAGAACHLFYHREANPGRITDLVKEMVHYEGLGLKRLDLHLLCREAGLGALADEGNLSTLQRLLNDPNTDVRRQRIAILLLASIGTQDALQVLLERLSVTEDSSVYFNLTRALNQIRSSGERRVFDNRLLRSEVTKAVQQYTPLARALEELRKRDPKTSEEAREPYLVTMLEAMRLEGLERIFHLLALLYRAEMVFVIHNRLSSRELDASVKAHAIELLENILDPQLAKVVTPALEEDGAAPIEPGTLEPVLGPFLEGRDPWFVVGGIFLVEEMMLKGLYSQVHSLTHSSVAMVRDVARIVSGHMGCDEHGKKSGQEAK